MSNSDAVAVLRVAVIGPEWCRMYAVSQGRRLVSLSFEPSSVLAVIEGQPRPAILVNGVEQ